MPRKTRAPKTVQRSFRIDRELGEAFDQKLVQTGIGASEVFREMIHIYTHQRDAPKWAKLPDADEAFVRAFLDLDKRDNRRTILLAAMASFLSKRGG